MSITRWTCPDVSPLRQSAPRERLKYQASPLAMVFSSAAAFMCATISTWPERASVATQVRSPSASNLGVSVRPSSTSAVEVRAAIGGCFLDTTNLAPAGQGLYISPAKDAKPVASNATLLKHVERRLQQPNTRTGGKYPTPG